MICEEKINWWKAYYQCVLTNLGYRVCFLSTVVAQKIHLTFAQFLYYSLGPKSFKSWLKKEDLELSPVI